MLNVMRQNLKSLKWVLWLVAAAMTLYLGNFFFGSSGGAAAGDWALRVNGSQISIQEFLITARNIDANYRQMFGDNYDNFKGSLQVGTQAVQQLAQRELILQDAARLGIVTTTDEVRKEILDNPSFKDPNGQFIGLERYEQAINRSVPGGVPAFEKSLRQDLVIRRWSGLIGASVTVSETEMERVFRNRTEKTAIKYVIVPADSRITDEQPAETELGAWYDARSEDYRRGEARRIRYIVVDTESQKQKVEVTAEQIEGSYRENLANYSVPEGRSARHILLKTEAGATQEQQSQIGRRAGEILTRLQGGEDFATLARSTSQDPVSAAQGGDLGFFARGAMVPEFEEAVFSTPVGEFAPVTKSQFGFHVIQVTDERKAGTTSLAEVEEQIRRTLQVRAAGERVRSEAQRLSAAIGSADKLEPVAEAEGLLVIARLIGSEDSLADLGAGPEFVSTIQNTEPGRVTEPLRVSAGLAVVAVDEVRPSSIPPLDEVKDRVIADVQREKGRELALRDARSALAGGRGLDAIAAGFKLTAEESGDLSPGEDLPATGGLTDEVRYVLFDADPRLGDRGAVAVPAGAMVYEITRREPVDRERFTNEKPTLRQELLDQRRGRLFQSMVDKISQDQEIDINDPLVSRYNG